MYTDLSAAGRYFLAAVLVLIVLILIVVLVVLILIVVLVVLLILLVIHNKFLRMSILRSFRLHRLPRISGFILCFEKQAGQ